MIRAISIMNWQSHRNTRLSFSEGVNVIVGQPNSGKTAILRALLWLVENRPSGASQFMPHWEKQCVSSVAVELENGIAVQLSKELRVAKDDKKVVDQSTYMLNSAEFSGIGTNVPDQIREALNLDELNVQRQLDSPFVLSSSAGEVARIINRVTHLESVDEWVSALTTRINKLNGTVSSLEEERKTLAERIDEYKDLPSLEVMLEDCQRHKMRLTEILPRIKKLDDLVEQLIDCQNKKGMIELRLRADGYMMRINVLSDKVRKIEDAMSMIRSLISLQDQMDSTRHKIERLEPLVSELSRSDLRLSKLRIADLRLALTDLTGLYGKIKKTVEELGKTRDA
jgi:DNA repair protein SbcC/Rad50